jgi:hypothetical protein
MTLGLQNAGETGMPFREGFERSPYLNADVCQETTRRKFHHHTNQGKKSGKVGLAMKSVCSLKNITKQILESPNLQFKSAKMS